MKLVTVAEMLAIEKEADAAGLTYNQMMANAGCALAQAVQDLQIEPGDHQVLGLVGPGNNGGDTLIALSSLAASGRQVCAYLVKREQDALVNRVDSAGGSVTAARDDPGYVKLSSLLSSSAIMLDGLLGTGTKLPVRGEIADVMQTVQRLIQELDVAPYVIAVDCPSGIDCDTGDVSDTCIPADLTVTMAAVKQGMLRMPAYDLIGELRAVDIGLPADLPSLRSLKTEVVDQDLVARILPKRPADSHKGTFGTAMIAAGSVNYTGAAFLAGSAAYRVGAGLVTLAVPSPLHAVLAGGLPEATWLLLPHELGVISREASEVLVAGLSSTSALLIGPGLGTESTTGDFVVRLLRSAAHSSKKSATMGFVGGEGGSAPEPRTQLPEMVIDADGLKLLARIEGWPSLLPGTAVLTPHPGEMCVLTGLSVEEIQRDRIDIAVNYAKSWGHVVVLKGAFTVIAGPRGEIAVIPIASAALARAGTGDVLAGMIVGLRAQGVAPYEASMAGAWIHAQAGLYAAQRLGNDASVLAGDVLESLAQVISDLPRI